MSQSSTYLRHPAVHGDRLVVTADDDLWIADLTGGTAHRLTDGRHAASRPVPSPDGTRLAFTGQDSGHPEAFDMPLEGGSAERLSYLGGSLTLTRAWHPDGRVVVATNAELPFVRDSQLFAVGPSPGHHEKLGWGSAHEVAFQTGAEDAAVSPRVLIGRHTTNQGRWKRYRGGTAGQLWLDVDGSGNFTRLMASLSADIASPMLIGERAFFISDRDGVGNLYSCALDGTDLTAHSRHREFYARFASTDGTTIVYTTGGELYAFDPQADRTTAVELDLRSPRTQRSRTVANPTKWLQSCDVSPTGTHVACRVRGRAFTMGLTDGPVTQMGQRQGANNRLINWLADGERLILVSDASGEERLEVHAAGGLVVRLEDDLGVPLDLAVAPTGDRVAITDGRGRLRVVHLSLDPTSDALTATMTDVVTSPFGVDGPTWSPDGRWLAFSVRQSNWYTADIQLWSVDEPENHPVHVTSDRAAHRSPSFDPTGRFLYWISSTRFAPVNDGMYFDRAFPHPDVIMAAVLSSSDTAPLDRRPRAPGTPPPARRSAVAGSADDSTSESPAPVVTDDDDSGENDATTGDDNCSPAVPQPIPTVQIDLEDLSDRVVLLPFPTGRYRAVTGLHGKVMALSSPLRPPHLPQQPPSDPKPSGQLEVLNLDTGRHEVIIGRLSSVAVSADRRTMVIGVKKRLRAIKAGMKPPEGPSAEGSSRVSGWIDLSRISVAVDPPAEWRQLFDEAWRLQRDLFWHTEMSGVDWEAMRQRYGELVSGLSTRSELTDLIWEMFGELGTGHAYVRGGDHPVPPPMPIGRLGADLRWADGSWMVDRILSTDPTDPLRRMPLRAPGKRVDDGALIRAIDGQDLDVDSSPGALLVNRADTDVAVRVAGPGDQPERTITVRTLSSDLSLRYADWVGRNRDAVQQASDGRLAYVHIPDMGAYGFAEFHRQYLSAVYAEGIVVDVRFNGGGNVSSLILEKLAAPRIGYQMNRAGAIEPYPHHAPGGPLVAVTNEKCGSDGDIFTHAWKRLDLGPVVGTRTWGGVIGISPRLWAVDGMVTTQPAYAFWFDDVGWGVENYGTDPTHPVDITPQDAVAGRDPQIDTAINLALQALDGADTPPRPDRATAADLSSPM